MSKKLYEITEILNLKDMLNKTKQIYADKIAYKIKIYNGKYKTVKKITKASTIKFKNKCCTYNRDSCGNDSSQIIDNFRIYIKESVNICFPN